MASFHITDLPEEILEHIFSFDGLNYVDIVRLSLTCNRLNQICSSNELWKIQFYQRWPNATSVMENIGFKILFRSRYKLQIRIKNILREIAKSSYELDSIPKKSLSDVVALFSEDMNQFSEVLDLLQCYSRERLLNGDLNLKYNAEILHRYMKHYQLKIKWTKVLESKEKCINALEKGAIYIAQWFNHDKTIKRKTVSNELENIANRVRELVPKHLHLLSSVSDHGDVKTLLTAINQVLYDEMLFKGNSQNYYSLSNSYINEILQTKMGIPISLSVIYMCVARRLGLKINGVNFPGHFLMQVEALKSGTKTQIYIDGFDNGRNLTETECVQRLIFNFGEEELSRPSPHFFQIADEKDIFVRMVNNILNILQQHYARISSSNFDLQSALELMLILAPTNMGNKLLLSKIYLHYGVNLDEVVSNFEEMLSVNVPSERALIHLLKRALDKQKEKKEVKTRRRSDPNNVSVEYRVGMIMKHKRYDYFCVIYSWDPYCKMDEEWRIQMGVNSLQYQDKQPFYGVLAHDGSIRYASQENLELSDVARPITHSEVGKYFQSFNGYCYLATPMLNERYPEDQLIPKSQLPVEPYIE